MRRCRACGVEKPLEEFPLASKKVRRRYCVPCWRERQREHSRNHYIRHIDTAAETRRKWRLKNAAKHNAIAAAYRARRKRQRYPLTPEQEAEIVAIYERARELSLRTGIKHHVDHIYPLNNPLLCGLHVPANLQIIPATLNKHKSNTLTLDTLARRLVISEHVDET